MRPAAVATLEGMKNPFDEQFDPFWSRVNEAGVTVVVHAADSGRSGNGYVDREFSASFEGSFRPSIAFYDIERAAEDWLLELMFNAHVREVPQPPCRLGGKRIVVSCRTGFQARVPATER